MQYAANLDPEIARAQLVQGKHTFDSVSDMVHRVAEAKTTRACGMLRWRFHSPCLASGVSRSPTCCGQAWACGVYQLIGWAWDITGFVFWVGIGHAGTLISAILFLFRQKWRTSINRAAEAMTIFAVICALTLIRQTIHVGRVWLLYWGLPHPQSNGGVAELP